ncbi:methyltransferase-like protein 25B [Uranotaenia lowii]|uniref:methyltransferase-like protein 25B n=1 Tax=Uranotaenia lowii TaxID=190385 RepID=UPI00247A9D04|nr:methyltransferase-like protein 25B [Uranotaenia lowii]
MSEKSEVLIASLKCKISDSIKVIDEYHRLIDSYVLDFYVDDHWDLLPPSWQSCLENLDVRRLKDLLSDDPDSRCETLWPLSMLAVRVLFQKLCLSRKLAAPNVAEDSEDNLKLTNFRVNRNLFNKSVKLKKRHEIEQFSEQCWKTGTSTEVRYLVDIGSGQGNLARALAYGFDFEVCCIEQDEKLVETARQKDEELASKMKKQFKVEPSHHPIHLTRKVNLEDIDPGQFVAMIKDSFNVEKDAQFSFGLIGLHPCGDLAVSLTKLFLSCPEAKFIKLVCCCYMKLTTEKDKRQNYGFPLSSFSRQSNLHLSYEAREIACHAIEQYRSKLDADDFQELKVHAFRAATERVIVKLYPHLKHSGLRSTKVTNLSFQQYCDRATSGLGFELPVEELNSQVVLSDLRHWERVVKFYTLRLMFAPLIESVILYDRWLYLLEQGIHADIKVVFDPVFSPRNHAVTGCK